MHDTFDKGMVLESSRIRFHCRFVRNGLLHFPEDYTIKRHLALYSPHETCIKFGKDVASKGEIWMTANSARDRKGLRKIGLIVAETIQVMKKHARPGMTTKELDEIGGRYLCSKKATSAPRSTYGFPGYTCISVNQEAAHGIPGNRVIKPGDVINIDVSAELDGYYADAGVSFQIPPYRREITRLLEHTHLTMMKVISQLQAGTKLNEIGRIIEQEAKKGGYKVIRNLCSHGIGRALHEEPVQILPVYDETETRVLHEGLVITVEPFLSTGADYVVEQPDGWTLSVPDNSYVAQFEHTIMITRDEPVIFTSL